MRFGTRNILVLSLLAATAGIAAGCEAKKQTEYVIGVSTQVQVPRDLKAVRLAVTVGGSVFHCRTYKVYDGRVQLPKSFGSFSNNGTTEPVVVSLVGFTEEPDQIDPTFTDEVSCKNLAIDKTVRILRRSRQPYVKNEILFLPMPLKYSCWDKDCETGKDGTQTCKAGRCFDATIDERLLPKFSEDLVDGSGGGCFAAKDCFAVAVPPVVVDADKCIYAVPNTPSAPPKPQGADPNPFTVPGEGLNVEITYDGGYTREILDKEKDEGFTIPDPSKPQRFQLAPGLCDLVHGVDEQGNETPHRITAIRVSPACRAKSPYQPLCKDDQFLAMGVDQSGLATNATPPSACKPTELKPARAALMILADDTTNSQTFYAGGSEGTTADKVALELSLSDPAFAKTDIGLMYFPGTGTCGPAPSGFTVAVAPEAAPKARAKISQSFAEHVSQLKSGNVDMAGALQAAYAALKSLPNAAQYHRLAVLVIGNRGFAGNECSATPAQAAQSAKNNDKIGTYALLLTGNAEDPNGFQNVGVDGFWDARSSANKKNALDAQNQIVKDLATCVYDVEPPKQLPSANAILSYSDPLTGAVKTIAQTPGCSSDSSPVSGWGIDASKPTRIRICGAACTDYRNVLANVAAYAALNQQPPLAVPIFAHGPGCEPKAGAPPSGGGGLGADGGSSGADAGKQDAGADASFADAGADGG
jgi:hypothetical protein